MNKLLICILLASSGAFGESSGVKIMPAEGNSVQLDLSGLFTTKPSTISNVSDNCTAVLSDKGVSEWRAVNLEKSDSGSMLAAQVISVNFPCRLFFGRVIPVGSDSSAEFVLLGDVVLRMDGRVTVSYARFGSSTKDQLAALAIMLTKKHAGPSSESFAIRAKTSPK